MKSEGSSAALPIDPHPRAVGSPWLSPEGRVRLTLLAILLLAAALRIQGIGRLSLWADEGLSANIAGYDDVEIPGEVADKEQLPPLYHLFLHRWAGRFGFSDVSLRLPSALFGIATVWVTFKLGTALYGPREGLLAALLMAVSSYQVQYAQEARPYAMFVLATALATYAMVRVLSGGRPRHQVGYVLAAGATYWSHPFAVFVIFAHQVAWLAALLRSRRTGRPLAITPDRWLNLSTAALLTFSPWLPTLLAWTRRTAAQFWIAPMTAGYLPQTYALIAGSAVALAILLVFVVIGTARAGNRWGAVLLLCLALAPALVPYLISLIRRPLLVPRYAIVVAVGLYPLAARGLARLPGVLLPLLGLGAIAAAGWLTDPGRQPGVIPKYDCRAAVRYVFQSARPGDLIYFNGGYGNYIFQHYAHEYEPYSFQVRMDGRPLPHPPQEQPEVSLWALVQWEA